MVPGAELVWGAQGEPHLWPKEAGISSNSQRLLGAPPKRKVPPAAWGCGCSQQSPSQSWRRPFEAGLPGTYTRYTKERSEGSTPMGVTG